MKKLGWVLAVVFGLMFGFKETNPYVDAYQSTCAIQGTGILEEFGIGRATGVIIGEDDENYFILTAGHLASRCTDEFFVSFPDGTFGVAKKVYSLLHEDFEDKSYHEEYFAKDFAILSLSKDVGKLKVIPLDLNAPEKVYTIGCSGGVERQSIVETYIISKSKGVIRLGFNPAAGRSGSGVFSSQGVVGMVLTQGGFCVSADRIQEILKENVPQCHLRVDFFAKMRIIGIKCYVDSQHFFTELLNRDNSPATPICPPAPVLE